MSIYLTEAEQIELIKKGWQRYSTPIMWGLSAILLSISALNYWHWHQAKVTQQASTYYEKMMSAVSRQETTKVYSYANPLTTQYAKTVYATAAKLTLAKQHVAKGDYKSAQLLLDAIIKKSSEKDLVDLARVRLARLLIAEHKYNNALDVLSPVDDNMYGALKYALQGDIYAAIKDPKQAKQAYQQAIVYHEQNGMSHALIDSQLNELAESH